MCPTRCRFGLPPILTPGSTPGGASVAAPGASCARPSVGDRTSAADAQTIAIAERLPCIDMVPDLRGDTTSPPGDPPPAGEVNPRAQGRTPLVGAHRPMLPSEAGP